MNFKRFLSYHENKPNTYYIIFNSGKLIFEKSINTFCLDSKYIYLDNEPNLIKIGIADDDDSVYYAIDVSNSNFNIFEQGYTDLIEMDLRHYLTNYGSKDFDLMGRANQMLHWAQTSKYCGKCGKETSFNESEGAFIRPCSGEAIYPKISPCILALIIKDNKILLAQNINFKSSNLYSVLAGYIETSETPEECLIREVYEEVGIKVKNINYYSSQAWPFPSQLMLAYYCEYDSGEIKVDEKEIIAADWYGYDNLPGIPPETTLSGQLIRSYFEGRLKL